MFGCLAIIPFTLFLSSSVPAVASANRKTARAYYVLRKFLPAVGAHHERIERKIDYRDWVNYCPDRGTQKGYKENTTTDEETGEC